MVAELLKVVVSLARRESDSIMRYELRDPEGKPLPAFTAGAHIDVHLSGELIRQYSLLNDQRERDRYVIGVLKESVGRGGSAYFHDHIGQGDVLTISAPRNNFPLHETATKSLLLAGGIGVTPILSMAARLSHLGAPFEVHYCARSRKRAAFLPWVAESPYHGQVTLHFDDEAPAQQLDIPPLLATYAPGMHLYVCGPTGFMDAVIKEAEKHWPAEAVHREYFTLTPPEPAHGERAFQVQIASSGEIIDVAADETIAAALKRHGVPILLSCEQGICGTCITEVLEGIPDHRDEVLTDEEHASHKLMTPCCSRSKSDLLVLAL